MINIGFCCLDCGNTEKFRGYRDYTEYGTEGILVDSDAEILDYFDREFNNSDGGDSHIEECDKCNSKNIKWLEGKELDEWGKESFDENGEFIKNPIKPKENPGKFSSIGKLEIINDQLLKNEITIEEYRQRVQEVREDE